MAPTSILFEAFVTLLQVAVASLHRGAVTVTVDAITGAAALLDASATGHRAVSPVRPWRPAVFRVVIRGPTARTALSIRHSGIGTGDQRT